MSESGFLEQLVTQALQIGLLTVIVAITVRLSATNRPRLAHMLWLIVVLKCVTPPIWSHPFAIFAQLRTQTLTTQDDVIQPASADPALDIGLKTSPRMSSIKRRQHRAEAAGEVISASSHVIVSRFEPVGSSGTASDDQWGWLWWWLCGGAIGSVLILASKFVRCLYRIRLHRTLEYDDEIKKLVEQLCQQLRLRRSPKVIVSDVRFGPAVVGIFRYVVILPKCLVADLSDAQTPRGTSPVLRPILAHELLHIRRGDLCVGTLQAAVRCLWWFHPAVWFVNRMLSRETERCCDEQVVAELGCSPLEYAQSLLAVIESKHRLKPVPVFPGMKPVEITSHRMERIMSLTQGSRTRISWRSWIAVLLFAGIVLPGAVIGQTNVERPTAGDPLSENAEAVRGASVPAACDSQGESLTVEYGVSELLKELVKAHRLSEVRARRFLLEDIQQVAGKSNGSPTVIDIVDPESGAKTWGTIDTLFLWNDAGDTFSATHDAEGHTRIRQRLDQFRKYGFSMVRIKTTIISGPKKIMDSLVTDWSTVPTSLAGSANSLDSMKGTTSPAFTLDQRAEDGIQQVGHVTETVQQHRPVLLKFVDEAAVSDLKSEAQSHPRFNIQQMSDSSGWNGGELQIRDCVSRLFVVGGSQTQPQVREVSEGLMINLRPEVQSDGIRLTCSVELSEITDVQTQTIAAPNQNKPMTVQVPECRTRRLMSVVKTKPTQSVIIGGLRTDRDDGSKESVLVLLRAEIENDDQPENETTFRASSSSSDTESFGLRPQPYLPAEPQQKMWSKLQGQGVESDAGVSGEFHLDAPKVRVLGAVSEPGVYEIPQGNPWQLLDALAQAGGLTEGGDDRIVLRRKAASGIAVRVLSLKASTHDATQNIPLQDGDVIVVGREALLPDDPGENTESRQMEDLEEKLNQLVSWSFKDQSLPDVFRSIATDCNTNVMLDIPSLSKTGPSSKKRVTFAAQKLPLRTALSRLCEELDLEWEPRGNVISVTTTQTVASQVTTRVYQVADLVILRSKDVHQSRLPNETKPIPAPVLNPATAESGSEGVQPDFSELVELIRTTVEPDSWKGAGSIAPLNDRLALVIRQTDQVHDQIVDLLNQLRQLQSVRIKTDFRVLKFETLEQIEWLDDNIQFHHRPEHHSWALLPMGGQGERIVQLLDKGTLLSSPTIMAFVGQEANIQISRVNGRQLEFMSAAVPTEGDKLLNLTYAVSDQFNENQIGQRKQTTQMIGNGQTLLLDLTAEGNSMPKPAMKNSRSLTKRTVVAIRPMIARKVPEKEL